MKTKLLSLYLLLFVGFTLSAKEFTPSYYANANGKKGEALKTALYKIMGNPDTKSYGSLWTYYYDTDRLSDNQVVDRYSNEKRYFNSKSDNSISGMNKEHGIPQSWWGGGTTGIGSDLQHVMPSDATANNRKSNFGMGVVTNQTWTNGSIKVGKGTAGNNGTVQLWEPADEWKGDFARIYFYIVTAYEEKNLVQAEGANSMHANTYPKLQPWAYQLYLKWSKEDPVDDRERKRNDIVHGIQGNRNPFIDYVGLEQYIWGDHKDVAFSATNYVNPYDGTTPTPNPDPNDPVNPDPEDPVNPNPDDPTPTPQPLGNGDYVKVTTAPADWTGVYLIVYEDGKVAMNGGLEKLDAASNTVAVEITDDAIKSTDEMNAASFTIEKIDGGYSIKSQSGQYIGQTSDANGLASGTQAYVNTLSISDEGSTNIVSGNAYLRYNSSSGQFRFRYYKSSTYTGQKAIVLYKKTNSIIIGDLNDDGTVTIADVTALVNIVLGRVDEYDTVVADVNGDGSVSIADVTELVNIILGKTDE